MSGTYTGVRFRTIFHTREAPRHPETRQLQRWCQRFADLGLAPERDGSYAGNLSFRTQPGFMITAAGADLGNITGDDLVQVIDFDQEHYTVIVNGIQEPSSETFLHQAIYTSRPQVHAVFHGHDDLILRYAQEFDLPITAREQPYGSLDLVDELMQVLENHSYLVIRNHGFIALGKDMDQAGNEALEKRRLAQQYSRSTAG